MRKRNPRKQRAVLERRDTKEAAMSDGKKAQEVLANGTGKAVETATLWAEANQRVLRELADLSAATAKESVRLYGELSQSALQALTEAQSATLRWQSAWQATPRDPLAWYQRALAESVEGTQKWFSLVEGNVQAVTRSAERLQSTAEQAGKGIQEALSTTMARMKGVHAV
jgi:hypothetical protein